MMKRPRGRVLAERYHANVLRTARQVHHTIRYVLLNHAKHSAQAGRSGAIVDPFSSGPCFEHWATPLRRANFVVGTGPPPIAEARTRVLRESWLRYGPIQP